MKEHITHADYVKLCDLVWEHNRRYYVDAAPTISDEEFDRLLRQVQEIEKDHPEWVTPVSPTQRVGEVPSEGFRTVEHRIPMLSLANSYSKEEVADFLKRVQKLSQKTTAAYSCELKMDGVAITAHYERGVFIQGVTRGDGKRGDDITANMRTIQAVPLKLAGKRIPDQLEVRGEVFMPHRAFQNNNELRAAAGEPIWANPRNAAAGSLKLLDSRILAKRGLQAVFYGIAEDSSHQTNSQFATHAFLKELGFPILPHLSLCKSLEEIWEFAEKVRLQRGALPFDIDGIVIKLDDLREQQRLGSTGKTPRWAVAYKFAAERVLTPIHAITVQVGRTGVLTPVAELEPVFLSGSTISRATLHNADEVKRKDIRVGDWAMIEKGGDVIPKVVEIDLGRRPAHTHPWHMPQICPACGTPVVHAAGEVAIRCPNRHGCPEQSVRRIQYFASKPAMDIDGMGEKVVEQLVDKGFVARPSDIYKLSELELSQLEGFKAKSIQNLLASIDKSRNVPLDRFIMALGIKHIGVRTAEDLAQKAGSIQALMRMSLEHLQEIEGIGDIVAQSIVDYFGDEEHLLEIERLLELGVKPQQVEVVSYTGHPFSGKNFVLTGTLESYTRSAASALIKQRGGKIGDSVTKKTDFLLAGDSPGSKLDKARQLGIQVLNEQEFARLIS